METLGIARHITATQEFLGISHEPELDEAAGCFAREEFEDAFNLFKDATCNAKAVYCSGLMRLVGLGTSSDLSEGCSLIYKAATLGAPGAKDLLDIKEGLESLTENGLYAKKDTTGPESIRNNIAEIRASLAHRNLDRVLIAAILLNLKAVDTSNAEQIRQSHPVNSH